MKRPFTVWNLKVAGLVKQFSQSYTAGRQNWQICDFTCKTVHSKFISLPVGRIGKLIYDLQ